MGFTNVLNKGGLDYKKERDTLLRQVEEKRLSTWPMPKPTVSNQIIPEPTQALTRAKPTGDKRSCLSLSWVKKYPFQPAHALQKDPPLYSRWKNRCVFAFM